MAAVVAKNIVKDANTLYDSGGGALGLLIDGSGGLTSSGSGVAIATGGVTNDMLAGSIATAKLADGANIAFINGTHTITGTWSAGADNIQITSTPDSANDVANKAYVDSLSSGLAWQEPVVCMDLIGDATVATINGLTPTLSDSYVMSDAGTLTAGSLSVAAGDVVEYNGTAWIKIVSNVGGFVPAGTRFAVNTTTTLVAPFTDGVDDGKIAEYDGSGNLIGNITLSTPLDGYALLAVSNPGDTDSVDDSNGYVYNGTVPSGTWIQFTGAGQLNAGTGLTKSGNTLNVGDINRGVQVNADDLQVDASEIAGDGLAQVAGGGNEHLLTINPDTTGTATIAVDSNGVKIATTAAGNGLTGGGTAALSVQQDTTTNINDGASVTVGSNGLSIDGDIVHLDTTFANFTPTTTGTTAADTSDLAAIIKGIDNALAGFGTGNVTGPGSSTDNAIARYDGATGQLIQNSGVLIDDSNNMTVPGNVIVQGQAGSALHDIGTTSGIITPDLNNANVQTVTLSGNATLFDPTNPVSGHTYIIKVAQNGTGGYTLAFGSKWKFPTYTAGTGPDISTGANDVSIISAVYDGNDDLFYAELSNDEALDAGAITGLEIRKAELLTVGSDIVTLSETPVTQSAVMVFERNGIAQVGFDLDGTTYDFSFTSATVINFTTGTTGSVINGDQVMVVYTYASS